jgi:hypothetical protein
MRLYPATNRGPVAERLRKGELPHRMLVRTFEQFTLMINANYTPQEELLMDTTPKDSWKDDA